MLEGEYSLKDIIYYGYIEHPVKGRCIYGNCVIENNANDENESYGFCVINSSNYSGRETKQVIWENNLSIEEPTVGEKDPAILIPEEFLTLLEIRLMQTIGYRHIEVLNGFVANGDKLDKGSSLQPSQIDKSIMAFGMIGGFIVGFIAKALF